MQIEATPKEPFTLGVLLRYKLTIVVVGLVTLLGGYVRIVTQPKQYQATARLAVRFTAEVLALGTVAHDSLYRLPLLEEEVKAYMVQIKDPKFIGDVLDSLKNLPDEEQGAQADFPLPPEATVMHKFREQFLRAYYQIRNAVVSAIDTLLFREDQLLSERDQKVLQVIAKLEIEAGTEASHIITVSHTNKDPSVAAKIVNAVAREFIKKQNEKVPRQNIKTFEEAFDQAVKDLVTVKSKLYELTMRLESPTMEEAIRKKHEEYQALVLQKEQLQIAKNLLDRGIVYFERNLPMETLYLQGELERQLMDIKVRYDEDARRTTENPEFYMALIEEARKYIEERRQYVIQRDRAAVEARIGYSDQQIKDFLADRTLQDLTEEYTRLMLDETLAQTKVTKAEADLAQAKEFNKQLENTSVSQNVTLWQVAQVPPFPLPQHRELKLMIVMALGVFAGFAAALARHNLHPKRARRAISRQEEVDVPLILLPEEGKKEAAKDVQLDITFPSEEGSGKSPPGKGAGR